MNWTKLKPIFKSYINNDYKNLIHSVNIVAHIVFINNKRITSVTPIIEYFFSQFNFLDILLGNIGLNRVDSTNNLKILK